VVAAVRLSEKTIPLLDDMARLSGPLFERLLYMSDKQKNKITGEGTR
jgi:hypothetical protein